MAPSGLRENVTLTIIILNTDATKMSAKGDIDAEGVVSPRRGTYLPEM